MRAYVYCRVSTEEQARDDHYSLEDQEQSARLRIQEKGWVAHKVRKDVGSVKSAEREGYQELLQDIQNKQIDVVVVYKLDRLSRNVRDIYAFLHQIDQSHIDFVSLTEGFDTTTPMGKTILGIAAEFAQLTRETIAENTRHGLLQRARQGKYTGGQIKPYGYDYQKEVGLVIDPARVLVKCGGNS
jgi:site-specific DNA recombinase